MFGSIAHAYDLNNHVHSLWRDQAWRRLAVKTAAVAQGQAVLDVACGTGDLTFAFARRSKAGRVVGLDFTPEMLAVAERKLAKHRDDRVEFVQGDAQALPFEDASFDVVSIAFGIRNVQDPAKAVGEFARVLRPGGRLVVLEFDRPRLAPVRWFNDFYCARLMPLTASLIARDRSGAYRYLPKSVEEFMTRPQLMAMISEHGFEEVSSRTLSLGICACTRGVRAG